MAWGKHGSNAIVHLFTWSLVHWKCLPAFEWMWHPKMTRAHGPWIMSDSRCKDSKNVYTLYVLFFLGRGKKPFHRRYSELFTPRFMVPWPVWFGIQGSFHVRSLEAQKCAGRSGCVCSQWQIQWKQKQLPPKRWQCLRWRIQDQLSKHILLFFLNPDSLFPTKTCGYIYIFQTLPAGHRQYSYHFWVQVFKLKNVFLQRCHRKGMWIFGKSMGWWWFRDFSSLFSEGSPKHKLSKLRTKNGSPYGSCKKEVYQTCV